MECSSNAIDSHLHDKNRGHCSNGQQPRPKINDSHGRPSFINHAEIAWHELRESWVGDRSQESRGLPKDPVMSWTTTYEDILLSTKPFAQPIPLAEMVDFLADIWYADNLDEW